MPGMTCRFATMLMWPTWLGRLVLERWWRWLLLWLLRLGWRHRLLVVGMMRMHMGRVHLCMLYLGKHVHWMAAVGVHHVMRVHMVWMDMLLTGVARSHRSLLTLNLHVSKPWAILLPLLLHIALSLSVTDTAYHRV